MINNLEPPDERDGRGRTWLFVPGDRPDRFEKAAAAGADHVIIDPEDAVTPDDKPAARTAAATYLAGGGTAWVRVNGAGTPWQDEDLHVLADAPGLTGIVVPKAEPDALDVVRDRLGKGVPLLALIETARGVLGAAAVSQEPGVVRTAFGSIDFALDIGVAGTDASLQYARSALVIAARAAGLPSPIDGVSTALEEAVVEADTRQAKTLGFGAKLCIHPRQVAVVASVLLPTSEELAWARQVLEAVAQARGGAVQVAGRMVDRAVVERARRLVASASELPHGL